MSFVEELADNNSSNTMYLNLLSIQLARGTGKPTFFLFVISLGSLFTNNFLNIYLVSLNFSLNSLLVIFLVTREKFEHFFIFSFLMVFRS